MSSADETLYQDTIQKFLTMYRYLRRYGRQMQEEGISGRKISTLRYLGEVGPLTIGQLGSYLSISLSSTSELIAHLQRRGYVTRTRSASDNRVVLVDITPDGRELVQRTPLGGIPLLREALKTLPTERLSLIHEAMSEMTRLLEVEYAG